MCTEYSVKFNCHFLLAQTGLGTPKMCLNEPRNMQGGQATLQNGASLSTRKSSCLMTTHTTVSLFQLPYNDWSQSLKLIARVSDVLPGLYLPKDTVIGPASQVVQLGGFLNGFWHCVAGCIRDPLLSKENRTSIRNTGEAGGADVSCQSEEGASRSVRHLDKFLISPEESSFSKFVVPPTPQELYHSAMFPGNYFSSQS